VPDDVGNLTLRELTIATDASYTTYIYFNPAPNDSGDIGMYGGGSILVSHTMYRGGSILVIHGMYRGGSILVVHAMYRGGSILVEHAMYRGGSILVIHGMFRGGSILVSHAMFRGGSILVVHAMFRGGSILVLHTMYRGGSIPVIHAMFRGGSILVSHAMFRGGSILVLHSMLCFRIHGHATCTVHGYKSNALPSGKWRDRQVTEHPNNWRGQSHRLLQSVSNDQQPTLQDLQVFGLKMYQQVSC